MNKGKQNVACHNILLIVKILNQDGEHVALYLLNIRMLLLSLYDCAYSKRTLFLLHFTSFEHFLVLRSLIAQLSPPDTFTFSLLWPALI